MSHKRHAGPNTACLSTIHIHRYASTDEMSLRKHVKADTLIQEARNHKHHKLVAKNREHDNALAGGSYSESERR